MTAPQIQTTYTAAWHRRIADVDRAAWDALAVPLETPFLEWEWLHQLEASGSICLKTGWLPCHMTVYANGRMVAAAPLYIKDSAVGEFVFDREWAELAARMNIPYYPKMVGMSPVTPISGYRFLIAPGENEARLTSFMVSVIERFCRSNRIHGSSFLFVDPRWGRLLPGLGYNGWLHQGYMWKNPGHEHFDDYLAMFKTNQRRNIKRERKSLRSRDFHFKAFAGDEIPETFIPLMYRYYERTNDLHGPWNCKYLNRKFFLGLHRHYRRRLVIFAASHGEKGLPVGMSILIAKGDRLYGRYWGSLRSIRDLHFETCYYGPIEWAISRGIRYYDPGFGGEHKARRGFRAIPNFSLYRFFDSRMQTLMRLHIGEINRLERMCIKDINDSLPFAKK